MEEPRLIDVVIGASICAAEPSDFQLQSARMIYQQFRSQQEDYRSLDLSLITLLFTIIDNPQVPFDELVLPPIALYSLLKTNPQQCPSDQDVEHMNVYQDLYLDNHASVDMIFQTAINVCFFAQDVIKRLHQQYEISRILEWPWYMLDRLQSSPETVYVLIGCFAKSVITTYLYQQRMTEQGEQKKQQKPTAFKPPVATNAHEVVKLLGMSLFPSEHQKYKQEFFTCCNHKELDSKDIDMRGFSLLQKFILLFFNGKTDNSQSKAWFTSQVLRHINIQADSPVPSQPVDQCGLFDNHNEIYKTLQKRNDGLLLSNDQHTFLKLCEQHESPVLLQTTVYHRVQDAMESYCTLARVMKVIQRAIQHSIGYKDPLHQLKYNKLKKKAKNLSVDEIEMKTRDIYSFLNTSITANMQNASLEGDFGLLYDADYDSEDSDGEYTEQCITHAQKQQRPKLDTIQVNNGQNCNNNNHNNILHHMGTALLSRIGYVVHGSVGNSPPHQRVPNMSISFDTANAVHSDVDDDSDSAKEEMSSNGMETVRMTPMKGKVLPIHTSSSIEALGGEQFAEQDPVTQRLLLSNRIRRIWRYQRQFLRILLRLPEDHHIMAKQTKQLYLMYSLDVATLTSSFLPPMDTLPNTLVDTDVQHQTIHPRLLPRVTTLPPNLSFFVRHEKDRLVSVFQRPRPLFIDISGSGNDSCYIQPILTFLRFILQSLSSVGVVTGVHTSQLDMITNGVELLELDAFLGFPQAYLATKAVESAHLSQKETLTTQFVHLFRAKTSPFHLHPSNTQSSKSSIYGGFRNQVASTNPDTVAHFFITTMQHDFYVFLTSPVRYYALLHRYAVLSTQVMQGYQQIPQYIQSYSRTTPHYSSKPTISTANTQEYTDNSIQVFLQTYQEEKRLQVADVLKTNEEFNLVAAFVSDSSSLIHAWLTKRNNKVERTQLLNKPMPCNSDSDEEEGAKPDTGGGYFGSFFGFSGSKQDQPIKKKKELLHTVPTVEQSDSRKFKLYQFAQKSFLSCTHTATWLHVLLQGIRCCSWYLPPADTVDMSAHLQKTHIPVQSTVIEELALLLQSTQSIPYPLHSTYVSRYFLHSMSSQRLQFPLVTNIASIKTGLTAYEDLLSSQTIFSTNGRRPVLASKYVAACLSKIVGIKDDVWDMHRVTGQLKSILQSESKSSCHVAVKLLDLFAMRFHSQEEKQPGLRIDLENSAERCPIHKHALKATTPIHNEEEERPTSPPIPSVEQKCECSQSPHVYTYDFLVNMFQIDKLLYSSLLPVDMSIPSKITDEKETHEHIILDSDSNLPYMTKQLHTKRKVVDGESFASILHDYKHKELEEVGLLQGYESIHIDKQLKYKQKSVHVGKQHPSMNFDTPKPALDENAIIIEDSEVTSNDSSTITRMIQESTPFDDVLLARSKMVRIKGVSLSSNLGHSCDCGQCKLCLGSIARGDMSSVVFLDPLGFNEHLPLCNCLPGTMHTHTLIAEKCLCCARGVVTMTTLLPTLYALMLYYYSVSKFHFIHKYNDYFTFRNNILQAHKYMLYGRMNNTRILYPKVKNMNEASSLLTPFTNLYTLTNMTKFAVITCTTQAAHIDTVKYLEKHFVKKLPQNRDILYAYFTKAEQGILVLELKQYIEQVWKFLNSTLYAKKKYPRGDVIEVLGNSTYSDVLARAQLLDVKNKYISPLLCEQELVYLRTAMILLKQTTIPMVDMIHIVLVRILRLLPFLSVFCLSYPHLHTYITNTLPFLATPLLVMTAYVRVLQEEKQDLFAHQALQQELEKISEQMKKKKKRVLLWDI